MEHQDRLAAAVTSAAETLSPIDVALERLAMFHRTHHADRPQSAANSTLIIAAKDGSLFPFRQANALIKAIPSGFRNEFDGPLFSDPCIHNCT